jgi:ABC-type sugar transport system ATPase subunit
MIDVDNLTIRVGNFSLEGLSFQVASGKYAVLMGKTGCGKTTILEAICGLRTIDSGSIRLHGVDVTRRKAADRGIGYVPQDLALFRTMTVREHLAFPLDIRCWDQQAIEQRVSELAELLGIAHLLHRRPLGLSGGESQRVALGRALAFQPSVLLLDEPLSALDEETRGGMCDLLRSVQERTGVTFLHVTHSRAEAGRLADQLLQLDRGGVKDVPVEQVPKLRGDGWLDNPGPTEIKAGPSA